MDFVLLLLWMVENFLWRNLGAGESPRGRVTASMLLMFFMVYAVVLLFAAKAREQNHLGSASFVSPCSGHIRRCQSEGHQHPEVNLYLKQKTEA